MSYASNSLAAAICSTISLVLLAMVSSYCDFVIVHVEADEDETFLQPPNEYNEKIKSTKIGIFCSGEYYEDIANNDDVMWMLIRIFLSIAVSLCFIIVIVAWSICCCIVPKRIHWQIISILSAIIAMLCVPIFLIYETTPCADYPNQYCELSTGAYILIMAFITLISATIITQCLNPPDSTVTKLCEFKTIFEWTYTKKEQYCQKVLERKESVIRQDVKFVPLDDSEDININIIPTTEDKQSSVINNKDSTTTTDLPYALIKPYYNSKENKENMLQNTKEVKHQQRDEDEEKIGTMIHIPDRSLLDEEDDDDVVSIYDENKSGAIYKQQQQQQHGLMIIPDDNNVQQQQQPRRDDNNNKVRNSSSTDDDLGSLEPTVIDITGEESILDTWDDLSTGKQDESLTDKVFGEKDDKNHLGVPLLAPTSDGSKSKSIQRNTVTKKAVSKTIGNVVQKAIRSPKKTITNRKKRVMKGYSLMVDNDFHNPLPNSPPLEILTIKISRGNDIDLDPLSPDHPDQANNSQTHSSATNNHEHDDDPVDGWNLEYPLTQVPNTFIHTTEESKSSGRDSSTYDWIEKSYSDGNFIPPSVADRDHRRNTGSRLVYAGRSITSGGSLLTFTIAEETAEDLESSDNDHSSENESFLLNDYDNTLSPLRLRRTISAPNLANFSRNTSTEVGTVAEELKMTGMNSFHSASVYRGSSNKTNPPPDEVSSTTAKSEGAIMMRKVTPKKKIPIFRSEQLIRGMIHRRNSSNNSSDASSSGGGGGEAKSFISANSLRKSRLRRIHNETIAATLDATQPEVVVLPKKKHTLQIPKSTTVVSSSKSVGSISSEGSKSGHSRSRSYGSGSFSFQIDMLDVQLAELNRPDGSLKGPEEGSC